MLKTLLALCLLGSVILPAQDRFAVTGASVPAELLKLNYGALPKTIQAFDLNICNLTDVRYPITSSEIYQALAQSEGNLHPIGRQIMLAAILHNQNRSAKTWFNLALSSTTSVLSIMGTTRSGRASALLSTTAFGALIGQQLLTTWNPVLTADQVEKFEAQVLEPALVMDGGSCVERTVFASTSSAASSKSSAMRKTFGVDIRIR